MALIEFLGPLLLGGFLGGALTMWLQQAGFLDK